MCRQIVIMLLGLMITQSLPAFANVESRENDHATQPYKYIGKELDRTHGARQYAPVTGRWNAVDALTEKCYAWSHDERAPYAEGSLSEKMGGLPVLIMGHDGYTRGFIYNDREIELVKEWSANLLSGRVRICLKGL